VIRWSRALIPGLTLAGILLSFALLRLDACIQAHGGSTNRSRSQNQHDGHASPTRIVPGSPALTEIVFALGQGHRVAAVGDDAHFPPQISSIPRVGSLYNPNLERLALLHPDLILVQGRNEPLRQWAAREGVDFFSIGPLDSLHDLERAIMTVGDRLQARAAALTLRDTLKSRLDQVRQAVRHTRKIPVFVTFGRTPGNLNTLYTCGPGSFLDDLIEVAGGHNVFHDATGAWPVISKETLLRREPEVILELHASELLEDTRRRLDQDWASLPSLPAVVHHRIHHLAGDVYQVPGPRVPEVALAFARALHPESFANDE